MTVNRDQLIDWLDLEEPTDEELACMDDLGHGDYEIYSERLRLILDEGVDVFVRSGVSQFIAARDLAVAIYTPQGDLIDSAAGAYLHVVTGIPPLKYVINNFADDETVGVEPGDVFYANDALYGGIHNPDQIAFMPIFHEGEIMAWVSAAVHTTETGAIEPGGMPISARTRHDEGMKLSPIKIGEDYQLKTDMLEMQKNFISRAPRMHEIDLRARLTTCDRVRRRVKDLIIEKQGPDFFKGLIRRNIEESRQGAKERVDSWNDGTFRTVHFADSVGYEDGLWRLNATMEKEGPEISIDYAGTSPENDGSFNSQPVASIAHTANYLFSVPFHDLPKSNGTYDLIDFEIPKGSILYPDAEASTVQAVMVNQVVMDSTTTLFSRSMYDDETENEHVTAPMANTGAGYAFGAVSQHGEPVADLMSHALNTDGTGGQARRDGEDEAIFPWCPFGHASNMEFVENEYPFTHQYFRHGTDSCGHGKHRGGIGMQLAYMQHHVPAVEWLSICHNSKLVTGQGLFGGYPPRTIPGLTVTDSDLKERMANGEYVPDDMIELLQEQPLDADYNVTSHVRESQPYENGDLFIGHSGGGCGYGDALERDPEAVMDDIEADRVSHWAAENIYEIEYDEESLTVDEEATERRRERYREQRLEEAVPFEEFEDEWTEKRPPEEILEHYGSWPEAEKEGPVLRM
ncbi:hydantoinase B/oxoprolinase family protein [Halopenitus persicus]|uniref:Acetophenone carboxylase n=1 Tax=Halopenitus persicus TaxID=1048396 RepID=A0A1H3ELJ9_9EURY|nr:hydantoinase B/oxoprolinase family protein [Halopenitus persicus]QHS17587.1 hydantoinase B/oxoprolinase family protein [haloarchaeon 3A1-DGR]SDX78819.1 acetophenone carboxylase [Halopenitus persicus]